MSGLLYCDRPMRILRTTPLLASLALLALVVLATACSSQEPATSTESPAGTPPFDAVLIELFGTTNTDAYRASIQDTASELAIACMEDAGFELQITSTPAFVPPDPNDLAQAQTMGFGIVAEFRHNAENQQRQAGPDPNRPYLETLTAADIERFLITLNGTPAAPGQLQTDTGCNGAAATEAQADWDRFSMALPNYNALGEERDTDPQWMAARASWQQCMADQGFDYADPTAVRSDAITRMRSLVNEVFPGGQVPLVEANGEFIFDPQTERLLEELLQFEQQAATTSIECRGLNAAEFDAAEHALQQAFVDRNQAAIDELLEAAK